MTSDVKALVTSLVGKFDRSVVDETRSNTSQKTPSTVHWYDNDSQVKKLFQSKKERLMDDRANSTTSKISRRIFQLTLRECQLI